MFELCCRVAICNEWYFDNIRETEEMKMGNIAVVFPGQGAQSKGMGRDFFDEFGLAAEMFDRANKSSIYKRDYRKLCFESSEDELQLTVNTQPAIYLVNTVIFEILRSRGFAAQFAAGHSLGEYCALYAAGVFSFEDGLRLIEKRASFMDECSKQTQGSMAAIMGLAEDKLLEICSSIKSIVGPAGYNSPGQIVISGEINAVKEALALAKQAGAGKCIELKVSGGWHSRLMAPAQDRLESELNKIDFNQPAFPVVSNFTAVAETDVNIIKNSLIKQLCEPVRWVQSVENLIARNQVVEFVEAGPGKVLSGLIKRINNSVKIFNINSVKNMNDYFSGN